jgi:hypothetical protein
MALTLQNVLDLARVPLNDDDKVRYPDSELIKFCNSALLVIYSSRPDLLVGSYSDTTRVPNGERVAADTFPFEPKFLQSVADVVTGLAQSKDEEQMDAKRVQAFVDRAFSFAG